MTIPETEAGKQVGELLSVYVHAPYLTGEFWATVGAKAVANRAVLRAVFAELDADPNRVDRPRLPPPPTDRLESRVDHDPDVRAAREDEDRLREERHDEQAKPGPRID